MSSVRARATPYYYTHANQNLGNVAWDHHTNLPASTVYYKASTGQLTAVAYNPTASAQTCSIYNASGAVVRSIAVPARSVVSDPENATAGQPPAGGYPLSIAAASASSGVAGAAVDANGGTRWESAFSDPQWLTLDMGSVVQVNRIILDWEVANAKEYRIEGSNDGATWSTVVTRTNMATGNRTDDITGLSATYRYFRIFGTVRNTPYGYSIYEVEVFGKMPSGASAFSAMSAAEDARVDDGLLACGSSELGGSEGVEADLATCSNVE